MTTGHRLRPRHPIRSSILGLAVLGACSSNAQDPLRDDGAADAATTVDGTRWLTFKNGTWDVFEDREGKLWFTGYDQTCRYDPAARDSANGGFTYYPTAGRFQEDAEGRLWMQNTDGIHRFDGDQFLAFRNRNYDARNQWAKADGDLWFGSDGGMEFTAEEGQWGVYRVHDGACTFLALPETAGDRHQFFPLTSRVMHGKDGKLWFGAFEAAFGYDGESFDIIGRDRMGRTDESRDVGIRGYHMDSRGILWMADNGVGLFAYDGKEVIPFTALHNLRDEDVDGNSLHRAFAISEDDHGNLWIGTAYSGVWKYEPSRSDPIRKGTFTNFTEEHGMPCEGIRNIYKTRSGELLFVGNSPHGVYRFDGTSFERAY